MITDPQSLEREILNRLKGDPGLIERIDRILVEAFVLARQNVELSLIARDPLGLAGPQPLTPVQERLARRYEETLKNLDRATKEQS